MPVSCRPPEDGGPLSAGKLIQMLGEIMMTLGWLLDERWWRRHGITSQAYRYTVLLQANPIEELVSHSRAISEEGSRSLRDSTKHLPFLQTSIRGAHLY
jgi:hypothetical protein